jgi:hypothetical protein
MKARFVDSIWGRLPVLLGTRYRQQAIRVYCPYCRENHTHSWDGKVSPRYSHCCDAKSPFATAGYLVDERKPETIKIPLETVEELIA